MVAARGRRGASAATVAATVVSVVMALYAGTPPIAAAVQGYDASVSTSPPLPAVAFNSQIPTTTSASIQADVDFGRSFQAVEQVCFSAEFQGDLLDPGESIAFFWAGGGSGQGASSEALTRVSVCTRDGSLLSFMEDGIERLTVSAFPDPPTTWRASFRLVSLSVSLTGVADGLDCTITGSPGPDRLVGTDGDDVICALAGNDVILAKGGNDLVLAGPGRDNVYAGPGWDDVRGGAQSDHVFGGPDNDRIAGEDAADRLVGGGGDDVIRGGDGDNSISGGVGDDWIELSGGGRQVAYGGAGDDSIFGGDGPDRLYGKYGSDTLAGFGGADQLFGGGGPDELFGYGGDRLLGGWGRDTLHADQGLPVTSDYLCGQQGLDSFQWVGPEDEVCPGDLSEL